MSGSGSSRLHLIQMVTLPRRAEISHLGWMACHCARMLRHNLSGTDWEITWSMTCVYHKAGWDRWVLQNYTTTRYLLASPSSALFCLLQEQIHEIFLLVLGQCNRLWPKLLRNKYFLFADEVVGASLNIKFNKPLLIIYARRRWWKITPEQEISVPGKLAAIILYLLTTAFRRVYCVVGKDRNIWEILRQVWGNLQSNR